MSYRRALRELRMIGKLPTRRRVIRPAAERVAACFDRGGTGLLIWPTRTAHTYRGVGHLAATPAGRATLCGVRVGRHDPWDADFLDRAEAGRRVSCLRCAAILTRGGAHV